jgi:hypothetical protein
VNQILVLKELFELGPKLILILCFLSFQARNFFLKLPNRKSQLTPMREKNSWASQLKRCYLGNAIKDGNTRGLRHTQLGTDASIP